jgi:AraC-like DNA-binding protein
MRFNDPEKFEEFLAPVGGDVLIRPVIGSSFNAEICMKKLGAVGLFSVSAESFRVVKEPQEDFYGLTIPLSTHFAISEHGRNREYGSSTAHLLTPGHNFDLSAKRNTHFLVSNFFANPVHDYTQRLLQTDTLNHSSLKSDVSLFNPTGSNLLRSVARTWSALNNKLPVNKITLMELEDDLLASFVIHSNEDMNVRESFNNDVSSHLSHAEEFICGNLNNPITRDQLAEVSGRSIRTLSRSFEKKHGIGPMAFIKQRRLDAAYLDLLSANPDTTTVSQVAYNYGFAHIGKFAIDYGKAFAESPSTSLAR